jgi:hypothetical protein
MNAIKLIMRRRTQNFMGSLTAFGMTFTVIGDGAAEDS